jgi:endoglucanase
MVFFRVIVRWVCLAACSSLGARAATVVEALPVTDRIVVVHFAEGQVIHSKAGQAWGQETVQVSLLNTNLASQTNSYKVSSADDPVYAQALSPLRVGRKSKGTDFAWSNVSPYCSREHWLYLTLPQPLQRGKSYTVDTGSIASNGRLWPLTFDETVARSEAVHVNLMGYVPGAPQKYAYVFHWMGDQGSLALGGYQGRSFRLMDQQTGVAAFTGQLIFRKPATQAETGQATETPNGNFLGAEVYECDFSPFNRPGTYVVVVEGVGCSFPFRVNADAYREPFRTVARGLYHNRSGIELKAPFTAFPRPAPHNPVLTPGFTNRLLYTSVRMSEWGSEGGDAANLITGSKGPVQSAGWYQDAGDWDSYYSHLSVAQNLLFAYEMAPRNFSDGELNLPEGINGVPDILDEAVWLPRFLFRLRHELLGKGYGTGGVGLRICGDAFGPDNPNSILQGSWRDTNRTWVVSGEDPWSTYRYAGACAHLAYCLSLTGARDPGGVDWCAEAAEAYAWARTNSLSGDETKTNPGPLKYARAYAAAALFRITGNSAYEDQFSTDEAGVTSSTVLSQGDAAYPVMLYAIGGGVGQPNTTLRSRMRSAILATADEYGLTTSAKRSLRWGGNFWMPMLVGQQTTPAVLEVAVGYVLTRQSNPAKARQYLGVLYTTCDYFLGGNSLNMTWVTGLGARHPNQVFHIDSWCRGYHPGMIPYGPWRTENSHPTWVTDHDWPNLTVYPAIENWPGNERWFDNRWSPMNSEFTISQTIGPSVAVFGLLCAPGLDAPAAPPSVPLIITNTGTNALLISWPADSTGGLVLEQNTNLSPSNWVEAPFLPADDGTNRSVVVSPSKETEVFRLKWPF